MCVYVYMYKYSGTYIFRDDHLIGDTQLTCSFMGKTIPFTLYIS